MTRNEIEFAISELENQIADLENQIDELNEMLLNGEVDEWAEKQKLNY